MGEELTNQYGGYISKLVFNNGQDLSINSNDIVVFVGPNNAGKSQSLKDIYELTNKQVPTTVIKQVEIIWDSGDPEELLSHISITHNNGDHISFSGYGYSFTTYQTRNFRKFPEFRELRNVFVSFLDTASRLSICQPPQSINRDEQPTHPIHLIAYNHELRTRMSSFFKKAFGKELIPNSQFGRTLPLCIGDLIDLNRQTFADEQSRSEAYGDYLSTLPQVQNQGDGIKSFVGILLNLIVDYYRIYLVDEPESFLHPPQARIMGHTIGELVAGNQQAFISTHSPEIIKGLMEICPERVKIVRITRTDNTNHFAILGNNEFEDIWKDPLLGYSEIMSGIFHNNVVLCESDSDCKMYSFIHSKIKEAQGNYSETLFIHSGGKQRLHKIVSALKSLKIPFRVIPDIDILNDKVVFRQLIETAGGDWNQFETDYTRLDSSLTTPRSHIQRKALKRKLDNLLDESDDTYISDKEIKSIDKLLEIEKKWDRLKKGGADSAPQGDGYSSLLRILEEAKKVSIYIVPVGELECFIKSVGGHGPDWVNKVIETYPDLNDTVYTRIINFVKSWNI